jgi:hypothetical protein
VSSLYTLANDEPTVSSLYTLANDEPTVNALPLAAVSDPRRVGDRGADRDRHGRDDPHSFVLRYRSRPIEELEEMTCLAKSAI